MRGGRGRGLRQLTPLAQQASVARPMSATPTALPGSTAGRGQHRHCADLELEDPLTTESTAPDCACRWATLDTTGVQRGLRDAVTAAGLTGPDDQLPRVVARQLRHTWATELANAGMSIQALMALLGHRSPEMTIRYVRLASRTLKAAWAPAT